MPSPASSIVAAGATTFSVLAAGDPADVPVVFLHGAGPGVTAANTWGDTLVALASTARCIAPDLPGYGGTVEQAEPSTGAVSWIEHSARAVVSLLDALGLDRVAVVGVGLGSCVALHAAAACPDRVDRAVLMSPPGGIAPPTEHAYRVRELYQQPTEAELGALLRDTVFDAAVLGDDLAATAAERMVAMRRDLADGPQRSAFAFAGRPLFFEPEFLATVDHEVLIVHGADNPFVSAAGAHYFAEHLPNAQLHVLERCAHYPQLEHPALCAALLAGFLTPA